MKTPSQEECGSSGFRSSLTAAVLAGIVLGFGSGSTVAAAAPTACDKSAKAASDSCAAAANSGYDLALGKCANIADPTAQVACKGQAKIDRKDASGTCKAQFVARKAVCARLGGATYEPSILPANFVTTIDNPFMPLVPGTTFVYDSPSEHNVSYVTHNTKVILGVTCVEVLDQVFIGGVLAEDTLDWYAQDTAGNVWYFGENTHELDGNEITSIEGSFKGGVNGAHPGIVMEAVPTIGDFYRQEFDLGNAEDMAEVVGLTDSVTVPYGTFTNCVKTKETSPLEPDALENKYYASGIGNVLVIDLVTGERLELTSVTVGP